MKRDLQFRTIHGGLEVPVGRHLVGFRSVDLQTG